MGTMRASEQRVKTAAGFTPRFGFRFLVSRPRAWIFAALGLLIVGSADMLSGQETWFGPAYLMVIGFVAWSLGWREAIGVGVLCMSFTGFINGMVLYPYGGTAAAWNLGMRFFAVTLIIGLLDNARRSCEREWRLARTDPLTGALNRKAFFELVGQTEQSSGWNILAYADLDGLKKLNDVHGHAKGDRSLEAYASHVKRMIRKDDLFARIGGDEFLVYMALRDEQSGLVVAERLHKAMNTITTDFAGELSCSLGVLILPPGARAIDRELRLADELMYDAKQRGAALAVATAHEAGGELQITRHETPAASAPAEPGPAQPGPANPGGEGITRVSARRVAA